MRRLVVVAMVVIAVVLSVFTSSQTVVSATTTVRPTTKSLPAVDLAAHQPDGCWSPSATRRCPCRRPGGCSTTRIRALLARRLERYSSIHPLDSSPVLWRSPPVRAPRSCSDPRGLHSATCSVTQRSSTAFSCTPTPWDHRAVTWCRRSALKSRSTVLSVNESCTPSPGHRVRSYSHRGLHRQSRRHGSR